MDTDKNKENIAGGTPSTMNLPNPEKHEDDTDLPLDENLEEAEDQAEANNMNDKKGYNETPPQVPVKSTDE
ncbi:hypothetical protein [Dyadobacter tibetensis]|uniref:hypothetical protein n=1 Tax=Dyadobacter tibetensis TaxID=1211851 RepID=UPI000470ABD4|nr:hypothetical protein [Dyadobacter tibetensis]